MRKKIKKELVEWIVLISIFGIIYMGGWHTEIIGRIQQIVVLTGIIKPTFEEGKQPMSYDFILEDFQGNSIPFSSLEGEVVFVNFWATWCPPCIAEMPDIQDLYNEKKGELKFAMISMDRDENKAKAFVEKRQFTFPTYFLRSPLPSTFNTSSIPTTYLLDKQGIVQAENHGMAKYNTARFKNLIGNLNKIN
ncbi:MAG: TlpA family protein disulfide reductase [Ekhidna sp.]|nr:TlpA family protein disulfide reductase [Ekhidna sp.]